MSASKVLPICTVCSTSIELSEQTLETALSCSHCKAEWEFYAVNPSPNSPPLESLLPQPKIFPDQASCYHHPENQAREGCESCGRLLCRVCIIEYRGVPHCDACWGANRSPIPINFLQKEAYRFDQIRLFLLFSVFTYPLFAILIQPLLFLVQYRLCYGAEIPVYTKRSSPYEFLLPVLTTIIVLIALFAQLTILSAGHFFAP